MKVVLFAHSYYRERGGEDESLQAEIACFEAAGYRTVLLERKNDDLATNASSALGSLFNLRVFFETLRLIRAHEPEALYANNLWGSLSPSVLLAARAKGVPVLQALRNYRLVTPSARLNDDGTCTTCGGRRALACVLRGCGGGIAVSALVLVVAFLNRMLVAGWRRHSYLVSTVKCRDLLRSRGLRGDVVIRPNFLTAPLAVPSFQPGKGVVFVGRFSAEKGVLELAAQWPSAEGGLKLTLIGGGELLGALAERAAENPNISIQGRLTPAEVGERLRSSAACVVPSIWAEPFGRVVIEAMSVGTPVLYSSFGSLAEIAGGSGAPLYNSDGRLRKVEGDLSKLNTEPSRRLAYARFEQNYSLETAARSIPQLLETLRT